ncbi:alpha-tocopherol transfer protein-like isoform X4 [Adelges cooleyi]|uniref:alpha-tocopherol transfer protein-like isoform X4 n=1 Tax=Adelges cooleyi TaxID=133065 RepID=UPI00217F8F2B|nr:alpha-tocopherol transfer protein-like isoform X4 [Adelges cooleyi]
MYEPFATFEEYFQGEQNKYKQLKLDDVEKLKDSLAAEKKLSSPLTDKKLVALLHSCFFDLDLARKTAIYCRKSYLDLSYIFAELDPISESMQTCQKTMSVCDLTHDKTGSGVRYIYIQVQDLDPRKFEFTSFLKTMVMYIEYILLCNGTFDGVVYIINCVGIHWRHVLKVPLPTAKRFISFFQEGLPLRLKEVHFINVGSAFLMLHKLLTPFISEHLKEQIKLHAVGSDDIFTSVPKSILPIEAGGQAKSHIDLNELMYTNLFNCREWFIQQNDSLKKQFN